ncbi:MAG: SAM-dependent methyltransferase [Ideonella sp.]|nr:SAM-dependent methyltransferase [Ideonella sp.]MCC7456548.1 SAM-dependent methyltransferase [Nitrospira sp.]
MHARATSNGNDGERGDSVSSRLRALIERAIVEHDGWLPFDRYMAIALYEPGLGYYARGQGVFGHWPDEPAGAPDRAGGLAGASDRAGGPARGPDGAGDPTASDFVTAPELTLLFAQALAVQLRQALQASGTGTVLEFGAGSGALAGQLIDALGDALQRYCIVEPSAGLRAQQARRLARFGARVQWLPQMPDGFDGVVIGNEVLDAMPVQLLAYDGVQWCERGVVLDGGALAWRDRPTTLRPPEDGLPDDGQRSGLRSGLLGGPADAGTGDPCGQAWAPGTVTELHRAATAFIVELAGRLRRGAAFFIDYGFPAHEYYHPQRTGGTLMCHRAHRASTDALRDPGEQDISAHVDFTGIALAGQDAGLQVLGYTSQARFLLNCGLVERLHDADARERARAQMLLAEHEMGELFKVIGFAKGCAFDAIGFVAGDRSHRL